MGVVEGVLAEERQPIPRLPDYWALTVRVDRIEPEELALSVPDDVPLWCIVPPDSPLARKQAGDAVQLFWRSPDSNLYDTATRESPVQVFTGSDLLREIRQWQRVGHPLDFWRALAHYRPFDAGLDAAFGVGQDIAEFLQQLGQEGRYGDESIVWAAAACWRLGQLEAARTLIALGFSRGSWEQMCFASELFIIPPHMYPDDDLTGLRQLVFAGEAQPRACRLCEHRVAPAAGQWFCPHLASGWNQPAEDCPLFAPLRRVI